MSNYEIYQKKVRNLHKHLNKHLKIAPKKITNRSRENSQNEGRKSQLLNLEEKKMLQDGIDLDLKHILFSDNIIRNLAENSIVTSSI